MVIFDSNIWIAYFDADDQTHKRAVEIVGNEKIASVIATEYIVLEVATVLKQKKGYALACAFLEFIDEFEVEVLESDMFYTKTMRLFISLKEKHLSFVDTSLLYLSKKYKVVTFDKHLKKLIKR